jgi:hypothetical protein
MLIGSVANILKFSERLPPQCAGSRIVVDHQRISLQHFVRFLRHGPGPSRSLRIGGHQHPPKHAVHPKHATGECTRDPRSSRPYRCAYDSLARSLADHPHPPTYCDAIVVCCGSEGSEPRDPGFARCTVVRYRG